jgi:hypothetical protein
MAVAQPLGTLQEPKGIFVGDTFIRHALLVGLQDLRDHPWQLPLVFASLLDDPYTQEIYGVKEVNRAVNWFLGTNIPVQWDLNLPGTPKLPFISVGLQESNEAEATLADTHYVPSEDAPAEWEPLTQKFNALYDPATGRVTPNIDTIVNTKMVFVDGVGKVHPIVRTDETNDKAVFYIETGLNTSFSDCLLKWAASKLRVQLHSLNFKETYQIGSHVQGDGSYLFFLDSIVLYVLLRYKEELLEGRGFERTVISRTKPLRDILALPTGTQSTWSRFINLTGYVKNYWAARPSEKVTSAKFAVPTDFAGLRFSAVGFSPTKFKADQEDPPWMASDGIGVKLDG